MPPILGTEESGFVSRKKRALSWAKWLPTAVPHENNNASRYTFPLINMQFSKVSSIKTYSFEPSPNHGIAGCVLLSNQHQAYSYSPQGCGKLPNKGNNRAPWAKYAKQMCTHHFWWEVLMVPRDHFLICSSDSTLLMEQANTVQWKASALFFTLSGSLPY